MTTRTSRRKTGASRLPARAVAALAAIGFLALAPAGAAAQGKVLKINASGSMRIQIDSPKEKVDGTVPMIAGRVEIAEGPYYAGVGKLFVMTRANLHFSDFSIKTRSLGERPLPLMQVGTSLRDTVQWWGQDVPGEPGVYAIDIPHDQIRITGDPTFVGSATIHPSYFEQPTDIERDYFGDERIAQPIVGRIDMNNGTITAVAVLIRKQKFLGIFDGERKLTITITGSFNPEKPCFPETKNCNVDGKLPVPNDKDPQGPVLEQVDPDEPPKADPETDPRGPTSVPRNEPKAPVGPKAPVKTAVK